MALKRKALRGAEPVVQSGVILDTLTIAAGMVIGEFSHELCTEPMLEFLGTKIDSFDVASSTRSGNKVLFDIVSLRSDDSIASFRRAAARTPELCAKVVDLQWQRVTATFTTRYDSRTGLEWNDLVAIEPLV
jgi:hypothetical protein